MERTADTTTSLDQFSIAEKLYLAAMARIAPSLQRFASVAGPDEVLAVTFWFLASLRAAHPVDEEENFENFFTRGCAETLKLYRKVRERALEQMPEQSQKDAALPGTYLLVLPNAIRDENGRDLLRPNPAPGSTRIQ